VSRPYNGRFLRVNLSTGNLGIEEYPDSFYRHYFGGRNFIGHFLLNEVKPGTDPLGPDNKLVFAPGVLTGVNIGSLGRHSVGAKSPLNGGYGEAEAGGYWGAELKRAGFDGLVIEGKASQPVYLWIGDGVAELKEASHLWGKDTGETEAQIREETGEKLARVATIGPAGERLVRYACVIHDVSRAAGRAGLGAVMGSKNLKAVAVRGRGKLGVADPGQVRELGNWARKHAVELAPGLHDMGTDEGLLGLDASSGLPTRNFRYGSFTGAERISGEALRDEILVKRDTCFACPVYCKRVVRVDDAGYEADPRYGGPEYETVASFGSNCGVDDLRAVARANQLCNMYSLDTISTGVAIAFAMECYESGILTKKDTDGLDLSFGNAEAMLTMIDRIAHRQGLGDLLAEGTRIAAQKVAHGADKYAMQVKGQELPMHEPRFKPGMGLGYAISPTGGDHLQTLHDSALQGPGPWLDLMIQLGLPGPLPTQDLSPAKVAMVVYDQYLQSFMNCGLMCLFYHNFGIYDLKRIVDICNAITGWSSTIFELFKVGERGINMARAFNIREGKTKADDRLPDRFFTPFESGPLQGVAIARSEFSEALKLYYGMMGWDSNGIPTAAKLHELSLSWLANALAR
jgi:aldehyde:ferredoxin oxidoreductase